MALLKLKPACKSYLWGGTKLLTDFQKDSSEPTLAETWELSCHPDGLSYIASGPHSGTPLADYIATEGLAALGSHCECFETFPILIKFIDAAQHLSVQVHPDDTYALAEENSYGKTEMWYIIDCEKDAFLYMGFTKDISKEEFKSRIENNTLLDVLQKMPVHKGDVFFIEAGTIHAIGAGIVLAEIQQSSNITYRVYDYDRRDAEGHRRDLHIEKALAVTTRKSKHMANLSYPHLSACPYFVVDALHLDGYLQHTMTGTVGADSFLSVLFVDGAGTITCGEDTMPFKKGDSFFITSDSGTYTIQGQCEALLTRVP